MLMYRPLGSGGTRCCKTERICHVHEDHLCIPIHRLNVGMRLRDRKVPVRAGAKLIQRANDDFVVEKIQALLMGS
jgi:hypothetical protein